MADSIVKVPKDATMDYDYIAFSFNGLHSYEDFGIYRTSDGDRYNIELGPTMQDKTAENPGGDGMYFFGTNHKQKNFNINFAFDNMDEPTLRRMKSWLNGKEMGDLWFAEEPYKVYTAKVTGQPSIKVIPFDDYDENGNKIRIYKGEGTVQFTAYWPYARTPDYVHLWNEVDQIYGKVYTREFPADTAVSLKDPIEVWLVAIYAAGEVYDKDVTFIYENPNTGQDDELVVVPTLGYYVVAGILNPAKKIKAVKFSEEVVATLYKTNFAKQETPIEFSNSQLVFDGHYYSSYNSFSNLLQWAGTSGLPADALANIMTKPNPGDLPAPFIVKAPKTITASGSSELTFKVGELTITVPAATATKEENDGYTYTHHTNIEWDSKTGIVSAEVNGVRKVIQYTGNSLGGIPVGGLPTSEISIHGGTLDYHYWYY